MTKLCEPIGNGIAEYSPESGKLEMVGYHNEKRFRSLMAMRRALKSLPVTCYQSDYGNGWGIKVIGEQWTCWTLYLDSTFRTFSLYRAIPDIDRGIDVEDEKTIGLRLNVNQVLRMICKDLEN